MPKKHKNDEVPSIPTVGEITELPRWARVAFAARCARRVQPLFQEFWSDAPEEHIVALERAIERGERAAAAAADVGDCTYADANAARAAAKAARANARVAAPASHAADAATDAARAAPCAAGAANDDLCVADEFAAEAAAAAAADAALAAGACQGAVIAAMRRDLDLLGARARAERWTNKSTAPLGIFGPLWLGDPPPGWPGSAISPLSSFELWIEPGEASKETIQEFLEALGDLHVAHGGLGLEFAVDGDKVLVMEGQSV